MAKGPVILAMLLVGVVAAGPATRPDAPREHLEEMADAPLSCTFTTGDAIDEEESWTCWPVEEFAEHSASSGLMLTLSDGADRLYRFIEMLVAEMKKRFLDLTGNAMDYDLSAPNSTTDRIREKINSASDALKDALGQAEPILKSLANKSATAIGSASDALKNKFYWAKSAVGTWTPDENSSAVREEAEMDSADDSGIDYSDDEVTGASNISKEKFVRAVDNAKAILRTLAAIESATTDAASRIPREEADLTESADDSPSNASDGEASDANASTPLREKLDQAETILRTLTATVAAKTNSMTQDLMNQLTSVVDELKDSVAGMSK